MGNEDQERNIKSSELKKKRLESLVKLFIERNFSDEELICEGRKSQYLNYNYKEEKFEFVEIAEGKNIENSIPTYSLNLGNKGCLNYWRNHINNLDISITSLKRNFK